MIFMVFVVFILFFIARGIFTILAWLAPILFILTLIFRYKVVVQYGKMLVNLVKRNPIVGIIAIILTVVGFPIVAFALFAKAIMDRQIDKVQEQQREAVEGKLIDYEIIEDETLDLPEIEPVKRKKRENNEYEDLF